MAAGRTAPPWARMSWPSLAIARRSRRTVISVEPRTSASSATETTPRERRLSAISRRRSTASICRRSYGNDQFRSIPNKLVLTKLTESLILAPVNVAIGPPPWRLGAQGGSHGRVKGEDRRSRHGHRAAPRPRPVAARCSKDRRLRQPRGVHRRLWRLHLDVGWWNLGHSEGRLAVPRQQPVGPGTEEGTAEYRRRVHLGQRRDQGEDQHRRPRHLPEPDHLVPSGHPGGRFHM